MTAQPKSRSFPTMVRPIMEHTSAAWDPYLQKDISQLERDYSDEQQDSAAATRQREHRDVLMTC